MWFAPTARIAFYAESALICRISHATPSMTCSCRRRMLSRHEPDQRPTGLQQASPIECRI
jgi:hypothetical protein